LFRSPPFFYRKNNSIRLQESLTAACILEQEAVLTGAFPKETAPLKRRILDGKEWIVRVDASDGDPVIYKMTAAMNGRVIDSVVFYGRKADAAAK
jgi:hypothetical protein